MGNRALVVFHENVYENQEGSWNLFTSPAIYLHWNGGPESVLNFLAEMDRRNIRTGDNAYEAARFVQIVGDFFDDRERSTLSVGILDGPGHIVKESSGACRQALQDWANLREHGDNGVYFVNRSKGTISQFARDLEIIDHPIRAWQEDLEDHANTRAFAELFELQDHKLYRDTDSGTLAHEVRFEQALRGYVENLSPASGELVDEMIEQIVNLTDTVIKVSQS